MDKKQKLIKEKFDSKLEIQKRKKDFYLKFNEIRQAKKDVINKNNELKELIKQEKLNGKEKFQKLKIHQKRDLKIQKKQIVDQKNVIWKDGQKFNESIKLEIAIAKQEVLNQKMRFNRELAKAKIERKTMIFENKKLVQKINQKDQNARIEQKNNNQKKKVEISKMQAQYFDDLAKQKKELENIRKQHILAKFNYLKELKKIKNKRLSLQRKQKSNLDIQVTNEKYNLKLDISKIKNEKISYKNLLRARDNEVKMKNEKLKLETAQIKQKNLLLKNSLEEANIPEFNNEVKSSEFFIKKIKSEDELLNNKSTPIGIDLSNKTIKGIVIDGVGKRALRIFNKINKPSSFKSLDKLKISSQEKELIKKIRKLKSKNSLTPISAYVQFAAFIEEKEFNKNKVQAIIISIIYNMLRGKIFSFLGGYFSIIKVKGYRKIVYSQRITKASKLSMINPPDSNVTRRFEKMLAKKLEYEPFIKISENIVLTYINNEIRLISDIAFMR